MIQPESASPCCTPSLAGFSETLTSRIACTSQLTLLAVARPRLSPLCLVPFAAGRADIQSGQQVLQGKLDLLLQRQQAAIDAMNAANSQLAALQVRRVCRCCRCDLTAGFVCWAIPQAGHAVRNLLTTAVFATEQDSPGQFQSPACATCFPPATWPGQCSSCLSCASVCLAVVAGNGSEAGGRPGFPRGGHQ